MSVCTGRFDGSYVILAFDLWDEIFREVKLPSSHDNYWLHHCHMVVLVGCLCVVFSLFNGIDVWVMKYGVRESWTKFTIAFHGMSKVDVLCLLAEDDFVLTDAMVEDGNGERLLDESIGRLRDESGRRKLVVYSLKKETPRELVVCEIPTHYTVWGNYIETLISPDHGGPVF